MELLTKVNSPFRKTTEYRDENKILPFKMEEKVEAVQEEKPVVETNKQK